MKKFLVAFASICLSLNLSAKKVKFAVDMTGQIINPTGVHVVGDFQAVAGFGPDWDPATLTLVQEGVTNIYSAIVTIPAFRKYEYKFVNGNFSYEVEIVPEESRIGYAFNDNRWMFVDSLANDTSFVGAILFGGNAPMGKNLIRYKVDLTNASPNLINGIHVGNSADSFSPSKNILYSFGDSIYEVISYYVSNTYSYRFFNGNTAGVTETVPAGCAVLGNRSVVLNKDSVLPIVCFSSCSACLPVSLKEIEKSTSVFKIFPNPATDAITISSNNYEKIESIIILNISGQIVKSLFEINKTELVLSNLELNNGFYTIDIKSEDYEIQHVKFIVE